jgi:transcriptional regulator with XRE-family HTH domain
VHEPTFTQEDAKRFRRYLGLSVRDFAAAFDVSPGTVLRIETGRHPPGEALKRVEIYARYPHAALFEFFRNQRKLNDRIKEELYRKLSEKRTD